MDEVQQMEHVASVQGGKSEKGRQEIRARNPSCKTDQLHGLPRAHETMKMLFKQTFHVDSLEEFKEQVHRATDN